MLFVVSSIAASGKTTLVEYIIEKLDLYKLKTCTTRRIRQEESGDEYHFITDTEFLENVRKDAFIEYATVYDEYYGLTKKEIDDNIDKDCIIILDVQGAKTIKILYPDAITIFILPPPADEIRKRLTARNTSRFDVNKRLSEMEEELSHSSDYDCFVDYGQLNFMKEQISDIIRLRLQYNSC